MTTSTRPSGRRGNALLSRADIARKAGVNRAAVTNWIKRHADFPAPVGEHFRQSQVLAWLDARRIPDTSRTATEPAGTTYGDRARQYDAGTLSTPRDRHLPIARSTSGSADDGPVTDRQLFAVTDQALGGEHRAGRIAFVMALVLLRDREPHRWQTLSRPVALRDTPDEARRWLLRIGHQADMTLRGLGVPPGLSATLGGLRPQSCEDVARVIHLSTRLRTDDISRLVEEFGRAREDLHTPPVVARLMAALAISTEQPPSVVRDPFARGGELLAAAADRLDPSSARTEFQGTSPDHDSLPLAGVNLLLHGVEPRLEPGSATPWQDDAPFSADRTDRADAVVVNPPFNDKTPLPASGGRAHDWPFGPPPGSNHNMAWIQHVIDQLTEHGRGAVIMTNRAAASGDAAEQAIRARLVEQGAVEAVITLPSRLFVTTRISVSVWLLTRPRGSGHQVLFVDARRLGRRLDAAQWTLTESDITRIATVVERWRAHQTAGDISAAATPEQISQHGYSLSPSEYVTVDGLSDRSSEAMGDVLLDAELARHRERVRVHETDPPPIQPGLGPRPATVEETPSLGDLCHIQPGPTHQRLRDAGRRTGSHIPRRVVHSKHLKNRRITESEEILVDHEKAFAKFALEPGDIVCVRSGSPGPCALVSPEQTGWLINTSLFLLRPLRPTENRYVPAYLLAYLSLPAVQAWIRDRAASTTSIPSVRSNVLGQLRIPLPSVDEQERIGRELAAYDDHLTALRAHTRTVERARAALADCRIPHGEGAPS